MDNKGFEEVDIRFIEIESRLLAIEARLQAIEKTRFNNPSAPSRPYFTCPRCEPFLCNCFRPSTGPTCSE
jgi:hypothetical protein